MVLILFSSNLTLRICSFYQIKAFLFYWERRGGGESTYGLLAATSKASQILEILLELNLQIYSFQDTGMGE